MTENEFILKSRKMFHAKAQSRKELFEETKSVKIKFKPTITFAA
jgi:hypothetical protein